MQTSPAGKTALGVYLIIVGLVMIIFHKQVKQWKDDLYENISPFYRGPTGTLLIVMIILFGAMSILIGVALLSVAFCSTL